MKTKTMKITRLLLVFMLTATMLGMSSITAFATDGTPTDWQNTDGNEWYGITPEDAQELYASVKSDLQDVTYKDLYNQLNPYVSSSERLNVRTEMFKELGRSPTEEEVTERLVLIYLDNLGMRDAFDRVMADLDTAIPKILRHSASTDANALKANKVQILLGLTYLVRYYGFEVGGVSAKDVLLYSPEAVGGTSTQDALTTLTDLGENLSYNDAREAFTAKVYTEHLSGAVGIEQITDFVIALTTSANGELSEHEHLVQADNAAILFESSLIYDGTEMPLVTVGVASSGTVQYYLGETAPAFDSSDWAESIPVARRVGNYKIWWRVRGDEAQGNTSAESMDVTIRKKTVTATVVAQDKTYDGNTDTTVTANIPDDQLLNGDSITISGLKGVFSDANAGEGKTVTVNDSEVTLEGVNADCYEIIYPTATATIRKAQTLEIVWPTANAVPYGQPLSEVTLVGGSTELGSFAFADGTLVPSVLTVYYKLIFTPTAETLNNYEVIISTEKMITVPVIKKSITITADSVTVCVGVAPPLLLTFKTEGLIGDDVLLKHPIITAEVDLNTPGEYEISLHDAYAGDNYKITYVGGTVTVREHQYGEWEKNDAASHQRACGCGSFEYGWHNWDYGDHSKLPTCVESGEQSFVCRDCGESEIRVTSPEEDKHADTDKNDICDYCNAELLRDGLGAGAIAGIVGGSVAALGGGGFALWWFMLRKKRII